MRIISTRAFAALVFVQVVCWTLLLHAAAAQNPSLDGGYVAEGIGFVEPGRWTSAGVAVSNPTEEARTLLSVMSFELQNNAQFGRELWLPPRSRRRVRHAVRAPDAVPRDARSVEVTSVLIEGAESEVALSRQTTLTPVFRTKKLTGVLRSRRDRGEGANATDVLAVMRSSRGLSRRTVYLDREGLPTVAASLAPLHSLVLASEEFDPDPLQLRALRGWLIGGGRLWLALDQLDPELPARLLGDAWTPTRIDEVPMTRIELRGPGESKTAQSDTPWILHRYTPGDAEVTHRVGAWPAAMRLRVGRGEVFVTTLDADAGVDPRTPREPQAEDGRALRFQASAPLADFAAAFYRDTIAGDASTMQSDQSEASRATRSERDGAGRAMHDFAAERIGYEVMPRGPVVALLAGLPLVLIAAAWWLLKRQRLEAVGIVGVSAAVVLAGIVLGVGAIHAGRVPRTLSSLQRIHVETQPPAATVRSHFALYSPSRERDRIRGRGGVAWPDAEALRGELARMIWYDTDRWRWEGIQSPAKAILGFEHLRTLDIAPHAGATATFSTQGLDGRVETGPFGGIEDVVLAMPSGFVPLQLNGEGRFNASADAPPKPGGYIRGAALSQTQQRRQRIYQALLRRSNQVDRPVLMGFTDAMDLDVTLSVDARRVHEALVSWPLTFVPPEPGTPIRVPAALIRAEPITKLPGVDVVASLYNPATRRWVPTSMAASIALRFTVPEAVRPLEVQSATLWLDLDAPGREVDIQTRGGASLRTLATRRAPRGRTRIELDADDGITLNDAGETVVVLRVNALPAGNTASPWQLHDAGLSLGGVTRPAASPDAVADNPPGPRTGARP